LIFTKFKPFIGEHIYSWFLRLFKLSGCGDILAFRNVHGLKHFQLKPNMLLQETTKELFLKYPGKPDDMMSHTPLYVWQISTEFIIDNSSISSEELYDSYSEKDDKTALAFDRSWHSCSKCRSDDLKKHGTTFWHAEHQTLSVFECRKHSKTLEMATKRVVDLKEELLPHDVQSWEPVLSVVSKEIKQWQKFVWLINEKAKQDPLFVSSLQEDIYQHLELDKLNYLQYKKRYSELHVEFEVGLGPVLLAYLFKECNRFSTIGTPQVLMILFRRVVNPYKLQTPIYSMAIAYWLRDKLNLEL
jgi:hypothetical protein